MTLFRFFHSLQISRTIFTLVWLVDFEHFPLFFLLSFTIYYRIKSTISLLLLVTVVIAATEKQSDIGVIGQIALYTPESLLIHI